MKHRVLAVGSSRCGEICAVPSPLHAPASVALGWPSTTCGAISPGVSLHVAPLQSASIEHGACEILHWPRLAMPKMRLWLLSTRNTCVGWEVFRATSTPPGDWMWYGSVFHHEFSPNPGSPSTASAQRSPGVPRTIWAGLW